MESTMQIIVALLALPLFALGIRAMFMPVKMGQSIGLEPVGTSGLNEIRGVLGGLFFASVAMIVLGITTDETTWFLAVASLMFAVAAGRVVGLFTDGFDKSVVPPLVVEVVLVAALVGAHFALR